MSITVIIVNWNSGALLRECLNKLSEQTISPQHILVVDNASSDNSAACAAPFPGVTLLQMNANLGFAAGNNSALAECDTEFVALLNPDAFPEPDWLECLLAAAGAHSDVAAFGSRQLRHDHPQVLDGIGDSYHMSGLVWREGHGRQQQAADLVAREIFSPCAAAALYRRDALISVGGFDEDFFCYIEDVDLGFRLRLAGYRCLYVPEAVVYHVGSATTGKDSDFTIYHIHRNLIWTYVKNMPGLLFWLYLPQHIAANLYIIARYALQGRWRVILKAKWDAIKGLPRMWKKRKESQARRVIGAWEIRNVLDRGLPWRRR